MNSVALELMEPETLARNPTEEHISSVENNLNEIYRKISDLEDSRERQQALLFKLRQESAKKKINISTKDVGE